MKGGYLLVQGFAAGMLLPASLLLTFTGGLVVFFSLGLALALISYIIIIVSAEINSGCFWGGFAAGLGLLTASGAMAVKSTKAALLLWLLDIILGIGAATNAPPYLECLKF